MTQPRLCAFCCQRLTQGKSGTRAREHVLKESWILALNHEKTQIHLDHFRGNRLLRKSCRPAIDFLAGDVCNACNSGWMNSLDSDVERLILGLAKGELLLKNLSSVDGFALSRWLLKTAVTFTLADSRDRRHLSRKTLDKLPDMNFLPPGFVAFGFQFLRDQKALSATTSDTLFNIDGRVRNIFENSERIKFAAQYDRIILGCSFVGCKNPLFLGLPRMHFKIHAPDNNFDLDEAGWELLRIHEESSKNGFAQNFLNYFLLGLTFWHDGSTKKGSTRSHKSRST